jgi:hypothetical protein
MLPPSSGRRKKTRQQNEPRVEYQM